MNKQLSDKGMKFVQTTSDGGKVRMAFEEISGRLCGKLLPFSPKNRFRFQDYSGVEEGDVSYSEGLQTTCIFFVEFGKKTLSFE